MVSYMCPSKPWIFQACHPAWERKGQKAMEGVAVDIELDTEIKFEHLQTLFCFSLKFSIFPLLTSDKLISWVPL